jgi:hypothetical protein
MMVRYYKCWLDVSRSTFVCGAVTGVLRRFSRTDYAAPVGEQYDDFFDSQIANMSDILAICLVVLGLSVLGTVALMVIPVTPGELRLWHLLRIQRIRRWITRTRSVDQPLRNGQTLSVARTNLRWHLILTCLFCVLVARAFTLDSWWLGLVASLLTIPSIAYALGSLVQRQKISILVVRSGQAHDKLKGILSPIKHRVT